MRKCLRCGTEMKENCAIKVEGAGWGCGQKVGFPKGSERS